MRLEAEMVQDEDGLKYTATVSGPDGAVEAVEYSPPVIVLPRGFRIRKRDEAQASKPQDAVCRGS